METLICPQCGAQLDETHVTGDVVRCQYCATQFRVPAAQPELQTWAVPYVVVENVPTSSRGGLAIAMVPTAIVLMVFTFVGGIFYFVFNSVNRTVGSAVNSALTTANDAKTAANAMKAAANAAANAAKQKANAAAPTKSAAAQRQIP
jgi:hypothetical protein